MHHMLLWHGTSLSKNKSVIGTTYPGDPIIDSHSFIGCHSNRGIYQGKAYSSAIMDDLASVVANVVERSSWEKFRRGRKCRFSPKGGLHHTSGDASLETRLEIPKWCYAYKSQSPSSRRTCPAAAEYRIVSQMSSEGMAPRDPVSLPLED